jgi:hypothetical protein
LIGWRSRAQHATVGGGNGCGGSPRRRHRSREGCGTPNLRRIIELLDDRDFGDADVWRAARAAAGEIVHGPRKASI